MKWTEGWNHVTENGNKRSYRKMQLSEGDKFKNAKGVIKINGFNISVWQGTVDGGAHVETKSDTTVKYHCYSSKQDESQDLMNFISKLSDEDYVYIG